MNQVISRATWEHMILHRVNGAVHERPELQELNHHGARGWQLVAVVDAPMDTRGCKVFYFRRETGLAV